MRAAVTTEDHGFDIVDVPDPSPGRDELVIGVAGCGVCGSDIKAQPYAPAGMIMGHELGGEIVAVGSSADEWREGTNVAVLPVISCGICEYCVAGAVSHCAQTRYIGMGPAGGFADFAVVPARHAFALPADLPAIYSALVEPFAVGLHGVHSAEVTSGDDVLIVGAGGVGLTTLVWALEKGGVRVTIADPDLRRREFARAIGATDVLEWVTEADTAAYDVAIECVGRPELMQACQAALRPLGRLVISGACAEPTPVEPVTALLKELTIRYSICYRPNEFREVIDAFSTGAVDPSAVIGRTLQLDRIEEAFDLVRGAGVDGRVLVVPRAAG
jgi:(R,R)-butanediol dehydrogenase / meso-butanediol dehydrogenase / diacetyl reductase